MHRHVDQVWILVPSFVLEWCALPKRRVTVHTGDMGYTIGPFAGSAKCPGRRVNPWMNG
jgi:hypothetical protein